jgi:GR25 family glycosyltransferase involved in LPS biosynthesis
MNYTIIHINDRAEKNINEIKNKLNEFNYINDISFFDASKGNPTDVINHLKIPLDKWDPYDGRTLGPMPGEYGIWLSTLNCFEYMIKNKLENLLIFEDDIILKNNFIDIFKKSMKDLPKTYDFLSFYYFNEHNALDSRTLINSDYIHKSLNQYSGAQAIIYSLKGAEKILRAVKRKGIEYTCDCFIFKQSHIGVLEGYSIRPDIDKPIIHDLKNVKSLIDDEDIRNTKGFDEY